MIDLYFHDQKLAIEIDENGYSNRNIDHKTKRLKGHKLGSHLIRIDPYKEYFDLDRSKNHLIS